MSEQDTIVMRAPANGASLPPADALGEVSGRPDPTEVADATDGGLAARLRAKHQQISRGTERFPLPGWDGELVLEAHVLRSRKLIAEGLTNEQLILEATTALLYRDDDGELVEIPGSWRGVASIMGLGDEMSLGAVVRTVLDNPLRLDGFASSLVAWMSGRRDRLEEILGE